MNRRPTTEMKAIISSSRSLVERPPAPNGSSLREWFAGLALGNPELMRDIDRDFRVKESLRIADELIAALAAPRTPSKESMEAPSEEEMKAWSASIETKNRQERQTIPEIRIKHKSINPTLAGIPLPKNHVEARSFSAVGRPDTIPPPPIVSKPMIGAGLYRVVTDKTKQTPIGKIEK